ncbi:MAG: CDP-alcohol phosphatidyltransferase family protein [Nitrospirae bacterium]|nr:CDP-alcohol phosphatidyltransferase family protein [Nitrospirota bacterium]
MIGAKFGHFLDKPLTPFLKNLNINPNSLTIAGFVITSIAAIVIHQNLLLGGIIILAGGFLDMLDGIVARITGRTTDFGAFLDSVLDRYSDSFLLASFSWYFFKINSITGMLLSIGTMAGALIVSYTKARAEGLGRACNTGLMERPERIMLLSLGAVTGWVLPVMWLMFILTHITALQRIYHVWNVMRQGAGIKPK